MHSRPLCTWENDGVEFFRHRAAWQRHVVRAFPAATITRERIGRRVVYRAFFRRRKVGVFGRLRGFGYATGIFAAELLHGAACDAYCRRGPKPTRRQSCPT